MVKVRVTTAAFTTYPSPCSALCTAVRAVVREMLKDKTVVTRLQRLIPTEAKIFLLISSSIEHCYENKTNSTAPKAPINTW